MVRGKMSMVPAWNPVVGASCPAFLAFLGSLQECGEPMAFPTSADPCSLPHQSGRNIDAECC